MPCAVHRQVRPSRQSRGYDAEHDAERAAWAPKVAAGQVRCRRGKSCLRYPDTLIRPGTSWHLGHPDAVCPAPKGPEHERCNTSYAGQQQNA